MQTLKTCPKCKKSKPLDEFHNCARYKDGKQVYCIACRRPITREYKRQKYATDAEYRARSYATARRSIMKNAPKVAQYHKQYAIINKNKIKARTDKWRLDNKEALRIKARDYRRKRKVNDLDFRILCNLQSRLWFAMNASKGTKSFRTIELVGCTILELKSHLEKQFKNGMTWDNYGDWHIDHRLPCASFDLTSLEQQKKCFHYTNLQPLWATTVIARKYGDSQSIGNINKSDSLPTIVGEINNFEASAIR